MSKNKKKMSFEDFREMNSPSLVSPTETELLVRKIVFPTDQEFGFQNIFSLLKARKIDFWKYSNCRELYASFPQPRRESFFITQANEKSQKHTFSTRTEAAKIAAKFGENVYQGSGAAEEYFFLQYPRAGDFVKVRKRNILTLKQTILMLLLQYFENGQKLEQGEIRHFLCRPVVLGVKDFPLQIRKVFKARTRKSNLVIPHVYWGSLGLTIGITLPAEKCSEYFCFCGSPNSK